MYTRSHSQPVVFHDAATEAANGNEINVDGYKTLTIEIFGTEDNSARTVTFYGKIKSGTLRAIAGVKISAAPLVTAVSTTGTGELWQFDVTGLETVVMDLTSITGGSVSVMGTAVS